MEVSAQISLYPLGAVDLGAAIGAFLAVLEERGLKHEVGSMSTRVWGDAGEVFEALRVAFERVAETRAAVMVVTISNACPVPARTRS